jgi:hypothetical protein
VLARAVAAPGQMFDIMAANRPMSREQFDAEYEFDWGMTTFTFPESQS